MVNMKRASMPILRKKSTGKYSTLGVKLYVSKTVLQEKVKEVWN